MTLDQLLNQIETRELEFKEKPNPALFKTLSAFANTNGGVVFVGISDKKEITGYRCSNADLKELSDTIVNKLAIHPVIEPIKCEGKTILRIDVKKSKTPVAYEGRYYSRVGNTTRLMDIEELKEFLISSIEWDSLLSQRGLADIDEETVRLFVRQAKSAGRLPGADEREPIETILTRLGLMKGDQLTNAAFLLFGKKPEHPYLSDPVLRIGRFKDGATIIGDRWIAGNLFHQLSEGEEALRNFINVRYEISGETPERKEHWDYPLPALREALMNALVHRDYFKKHEQIMIKIYDDEIWFYNPGGFPKGLSIEQLKAKPQSIPRNPLIATIFYLAGYIERYGSGIQRIFTTFADAGLPEPEFKTDSWGLSLRMQKDIFTEDYLAQMDLNERQLQAIPYLRKQGSISKREYQDLVSISTRTALYDLTVLVNKGVLVRVGTGKSSRYVLSSKPQNPRSDNSKTISKT
ncbi:MAG: ATP-binding protein [Methanoregula sp.]|nr:ATP-binding protein [Methanoregula sp.]